MYSAVLMLALTAGSETADFGHHRCHGSTTGCSVVATYPVGCTSACHERHHLFGNRSHGCTASYGCTAYAAPVSYGCSSSCHGGGLFSRLRSHGCHGCTASYGCTTTYGCTGGAVIVPGVKEMPKREIPKTEPLPNPKKAQIAAPATIIVSLPAGARLSVDGTPTNSASEVRTLVTPNLEVGSTYVYTMRAEIVRDGQTVAQTQTVNVRGGQTSTVQFQFPQGVASR
jgi:uncharacterized protein (TIGR03000 family)